MSSLIRTDQNEEVKDIKVLEELREMVRKETIKKLTDKEKNLRGRRPVGL